MALRAVATGLIQPLALVSPPGDERRIRLLRPEGVVEEEPLLDLSDRMVELQPNFDERGFLGLASHPDFAANGRFYVYYSAPLRAGSDRPEWDHTSHPCEFRVAQGDPDRADPASERILLRVDQRPDSLLGKVLRLDVSGYPQRIESAPRSVPRG